MKRPISISKAVPQILLLRIGIGLTEVSSYVILLGSSSIELRVKADKTQEPVLFPVAPIPYLTSNGRKLTGEANSLEKNHLLIQ